MPTFVAIWAGQLVSSVGAVLNEFGLAVWVLQHTSSVLPFAVANLFIWVPLIVVSPVAGVLTDRFDRSRILLVSNVGSTLVMAVLTVVVIAGALQVWIVYAVTLLLSTFGALLFPAFTASIPVLVPQRHWGRANGMMQFTGSVSRLVGPAVAGALMVTVGLTTIVVLNLLSFLVAILPLLWLRIPAPRRAADAPARRWSGGVAAMGPAVRYVRDSAGLSGLLTFLLVGNLCTGVFLGLLSPLVLSFSTPVELGIVSAVGGVGLLAGAVLMTLWAGPERRIPLVIGSGALSGAALVLVGARPVLATIAVGAFLHLFSSSVVTPSHMTIWQRQVPRQLLGRTLALVRSVSWSSLPVSILVSGAVVDHVAEPAMRPGGPLAGSVGLLMGTGMGRGIGLVLVVAGLLKVGNAISAWLTPAVRRVEVEAAAPARGIAAAESHVGP
jgi:MFS transporter, DHA3 family, macrolide efflux protein